MPAFLSCPSHLAWSVRAVHSTHRLAELDDYLLRDIGLRRTDLYALGHLHGARIKVACCRFRDLAFRLLTGGQTACSC